MESELSRVTEAAHNEQQQASWEALTVFDALKGQPRERFLATVKRLKRNNQELAVLEHDAIEIMKMRRQWREFPAVEPSPSESVERQPTTIGAASQRSSARRSRAEAIGRQRVEQADPAMRTI